MSLVPLPFTLPLISAAILVGAARWIPRRWADSISLAIAAIVTGVCVVLLRESSRHILVYWFGGWRPVHGFPLGVAFTVDSTGAGLATLAAGLVTAALFYSWRYFDEIGNLYHAIMLIFLASLCGFCLTGDLFNLFVCFELMSIAAFALTAYKIEDEKALVGAFNFAVTNTIAAFIVLIGIAFLYARTGELNMAMIGEAIAAHPADGLVVGAFSLICAGFFVKGAVVPFHFWLADAHAVAPAPVCVLFSGAMVTIELIDVARVFWIMFAPTLAAHDVFVRAIFVGFGVLTVLVGGIMCFLQRHIKRLLAFSTISSMGVLLCGIALLDAHALAGVLIDALGDGLVKAALFFSAGILLARFSTVDEIDLRGRGKDMRWSGWLFLLGGLGLTGLPPFPTALGNSVIEAAARHYGYSWLPLVFFIGCALTGGAVLRITGRIYLGWGPDPGEEQGATRGNEPTETESAPDLPPRPLLFSPIILLVAALAAGFFPQVGRWAASSAAGFINTSAYIHTVLGSLQILPQSNLSAHFDNAGLIWCIATTFAAFGFAWLALRCDLLPDKLYVPFAKASSSVIVFLRLIHSGDVRDYIAWLVLGSAVLGGLLAVSVR